MTQRRTRRPSGDAGVSLVELLMTSLVSMVVLAAVGVVFTGTLKATSRASTQVAATAEARQALDVMTRRIRVGVRPASGGSIFSSATATSMTFSASLTTPGTTTDPAPSTVTYAVDTARRCLRETLTPASGPVRAACLAYGTATTPTFAYYQVAKRPTLEAPSPSPVPTTPLPLGPSGLSSADLARVGAVEITVSVTSGELSRQGRPVVLRTRVLLANDLNEETT